MQTKSMVCVISPFDLGSKDDASCHTDLPLVRGNQYVHTVFNFHKNVGAGPVAKDVQVIVLSNDALQMQRVMGEFDERSLPTFSMAKVSLAACYLCVGMS